MLVERYGALKIKQRVHKKSSGERKYFDSADWQMVKQGKHVADPLLDYGPVDQLPVKSEPTIAASRSRTHLDAVVWAEPIALPVQQSRNVIDI